ncbi:MAG: hypothetical protein ACHBN1_17285 [Heteroscytonema crispum UTEX LB 1556]
MLTKNKRGLFAFIFGLTFVWAIAFLYYLAQSKSVKIAEASSSSMTDSIDNCKDSTNYTHTQNFQVPPNSTRVKADIICKNGKPFYITIQIISESQPTETELKFFGVLVYTTTSIPKQQPVNQISLLADGAETFKASSGKTTTSELLFPFVTKEVTAYGAGASGYKLPLHEFPAKQYQLQLQWVEYQVVANK